MTSYDVLEIIIVVAFLPCYSSKQFDGNLFEIEHIYWMNFVENHNIKSEIISNLPITKINGLCEKILNEYFDIDIYFNFTAAFNLSPLCKEKTLIFVSDATYVNVNLKQKMCPCYGRHNPMRTNWRVDDNFDLIWLSDGPVDRSLFVYTCRRISDIEICHLYDYITQHDFDDLILIIGTAEVEQELETLEKLSSTANQILTESIYVREIVEKIDICDLPEEEKRALCESLLGRKFYADYWILNEPFEKLEIMENNNTFKCEKKPVQLVFEEKFEYLKIEQRMFSCHDKNLEFEDMTRESDAEQELTSGSDDSEMYLSSGPRQNSIFVFHRSGENYYFFKLFDYVNVKDVLASDDTQAIETAEKFSVQEILTMEKTYFEEVFEDPVCNLPQDKKLFLCEMVIQEAYDDFNWSVNQTAFYSSEIKCEEKSILFLTSSKYNNQGITGMMFPCYVNNVVKNEYSKIFYLSKGSRKNSVVVYENVYNNCVFFELIENVNFGAL